MSYLRPSSPQSKGSKWTRYMSMLQVILSNYPSRINDRLMDFSIRPAAAAAATAPQEQGPIETQGAALLPLQHQNKSKRRGSKLNKSSSSKKENKGIEILDDDDGQISRNFCDGYGQEITTIA
eukprot:scaffold2818_cov133-Skeletonema_marinoi.AAC.12